MYHGSLGQRLAAGHRVRGEAVTTTVSGAKGESMDTEGSTFSWQHRTAQVSAQVTVCLKRRLLARTTRPLLTHRGLMQSGTEVPKARVACPLSCRWSSQGWCQEHELEHGWRVFLGERSGGHGGSPAMTESFGQLSENWKHTCLSEFFYRVTSDVFPHFDSETRQRKTSCQSSVQAALTWPWLWHPA